MYKIYTNVNVKESVKVDYIITEDSKAGYQFFKKVYSSEHLQCISADGKSNIYKHLKKDKNVLVVADGAAFGSEMKDISECGKNNHEIGRLGKIILKSQKNPFLLSYYMVY